MNVRQIITIIIGIIIALGGLAFAISFLANSSPAQISTEINFTNSSTGETSKVTPGASVAGKGNLTLGEHEILQLTTEDSALELVSAEFNEKTDLIDMTRARVNSGSVLAVNLVLGSELTLLDDRIAATNHGGSFVFEKDVSVDKNSTLIRVLSGDLQLTFVDSTNSETFEGTLLAGEEVDLDDAAVKEIFAAGDEIARVAAWRSKIGKFSSQFESESKLVTQILSKLPDSTMNKILSFLKENLILSSAKKADFYAAQFASALGLAARGDTSEFEKLIATTNESKRTMLQSIAARTLLYTRLLAPASLSPALKLEIDELGKLSAPLANFAGVTGLSPEESLNRNLMSILDDPTNTNQTARFLALAKNGIKIADETGALLLLKILKINPQTTTADWIDAWSTINNARIVDNHDLANAVTDQLDLVNVLIKAGRKELSGAALKELAGLLGRASTVFDQGSLEMIAAAGNEFRSRVLFLASLRDEGPFDEAAYKTWLAEQEKVSSPEETTPENNELIAPTDDPNRVSRPESELTKFLKIKFTESDTQATEEKKSEESTDTSKPPAETSPATTTPVEIPATTPAE